MKLTFATTNTDKFNKAVSNLKPFNITLTQEKLHLEEMQTHDGLAITKHKAQQAYDLLGKPVLVNDDTWEIPALNGFPATAMKLCNHFLKADDWLRLMAGVNDRSIYLISHYAFHDGQTIHTSTQKYQRYFLDQKQGEHPGAPHLTVVARSGHNTSVAQDISSGNIQEPNSQVFWQQLAKTIKEHGSN